MKQSQDPIKKAQLDYVSQGHLPLIASSRNSVNQKVWLGSYD